MSALIPAIISLILSRRGGGGGGGGGYGGGGRGGYRGGGYRGGGRQPKSIEDVSNDHWRKQIYKGALENDFEKELSSIDKGENDAEPTSYVKGIAELKADLFGRGR